MNNSNSDPLVDLSQKLNLYGNILILLIGNVTNIVKICFFLQSPLRSKSCSYYILAGTFSDLFFLNNQPLIRVLRQLNLVKPMTSLECPIRSYLQTLSFSLSFTFLIFAAFDRYCFTSREYNRRKFSNPHTAFRFIVICTFTWIIFNTHHLFQHKLHNGICTTRFAHAYLRPFMTTFFCVIPLILIVLNVLTMINIRSMKNSLRSRVNMQLTFLILLETILTTISILPQTALMIYFRMTQHIHRTTTQRSIENLIDMIFKLIAYSECTMGFVIYLIALSNLRRRFIRKICIRIDSSNERTL
jgi:hypothetical protein